MCIRDRVQDAGGLIAAFEQALAERKGVATYQGKMIENQHVDTARKVLATREAIDALSAG